MEAIRAMCARYEAIMPNLYPLVERWEADYVTAHKCEPTTDELDAAAQQIFDQLWAAASQTTTTQTNKE